MVALGSSAFASESRIMLTKLWAFLKKNVVGEVPDELSACIECRVAQCGGEKFLTCPNRLNRAEGLKAMRSQPPSTG